MIGRFRRLFQILGEFFRQYFFAFDRQELPFNRAERVWVYRAALDADNTRGFMFALGCIQSLRCNRNTCPTGVTTHNPRLQRGLVVTDKAERVAHYARNLMHEVGVIAHSCGVDDPRRLQRKHCRIVGSDGVSLRMDDLYPYPATEMEA